MNSQQAAEGNVVGIDDCQDAEARAGGNRRRTKWTPTVISVSPDGECAAAIVIKIETDEVGRGGDVGVGDGVGVGDVAGVADAEEPRDLFLRGRRWRTARFLWARR